MKEHFVSYTKILCPPLQNFLTKIILLLFTNETYRLLESNYIKSPSGLSPVIMSQVFPLKDNIRCPSENIFITRNVKSVRYGTGTLAHLRPKIWSIIPSDIKEEQALKLFTMKIKQWKPERCPCKLCKTYVRGLGDIN